MGVLPGSLYQFIKSLGLIWKPSTHAMTGRQQTHWSIAIHWTCLSSSRYKLSSKYLKNSKSYNVLTAEIHFQSFLLQRNPALGGATKMMANLLWSQTLVRRLRSIVRPQICSPFSVKWPTHMVTCTGEQPLMFCVSILLILTMQHTMKAVNKTSTV